MFGNFFSCPKCQPGLLTLVHSNNLSFQIQSFLIGDHTLWVDPDEGVKCAERQEKEGSDGLQSGFFFLTLASPDLVLGAGRKMTIHPLTSESSRLTCRKLAFPRVGGVNRDMGNMREVVREGFQNGGWAQRGAHTNK